MAEETKQEPKVKKLPLGLIGLVVLALIAFGVYQLVKKDDPQASTDSHQNFTYEPVLGDPQGQTYDGVKVQDGQSVAGVQQTAPVSGPGDQSQQTQQPAPVQDRPRQVNQSPRVVQPAQPSHYSNASAGFEFSIPAGNGVVAGQSTTNQISFHNAQTGQLFGWVDMYSNTDGATIQTIQSQLSQSSDIYNIQQTTFGGLPALRYTAYSTGRTSIVVIHNGRVYNINGGLIEGSFANTFRFI